jgi:hypothetical protein
MKIAATGLAAILLVNGANGFQHKGSAQPWKRSADEVAYQKPTYWSANSITPFHDSDKKMSFDLVTSWIPGEDHKGMLRYRISGHPIELTPEQRSHEMNVRSISARAGAPNLRGFRRLGWGSAAHSSPHRWFGSGGATKPLLCMASIKIPQRSK